MDQARLDETVRASLSSGADVWRMGRDHVTPMSITIDEATKGLDRDIEVYWVDGGVPETFQLSGLSPAPIVFSTRFIEVAATLYRLQRSNEFSAELLAMLSERVNLQLIAELTLRHGHAPAAAYLFGRSLLAAPGLSLPSSTLHALEIEPVDESYMTVWFYGLLHEIGHVYADAHGSQDVINDEELADRTASGIDDAGFPHELTVELRDRLATKGKRHSASPETLREEIAADLFGVHALFRATVAMMNRAGRIADFDPLRLALCVIEMFNVLAMLNYCKVAAFAAAGVGPDVRDNPWANVAYRVRIERIVDFIAALSAGHGGDPAAMAAAIRAASGQTEQHIAAVECGHARAMRQGFWPVERDVQLLDRIRALPGEKLFELTDVDRFAVLAADLGIDHPDIAALRAAVAGESADTERHFRGLWIRRPDGVALPFGVLTDRGYTVFVFASDLERYDDFSRLSAAAVHADCQLEETLILARTAWEAQIVVARAVAEHYQDRTLVVVEGCASFDRLMSDLLARPTAQAGRQR